MPQPALQTRVPHAKTAEAYLRTRVLTASPEELRLMLLEGAIRFAQQGRAGMVDRQFEACFLGLSQCRDIVMELLTTIRSDVNAELAEHVKNLYTFMYTQLVEAGHEKDVKKLDAVISLLTYERETWVLLMQKLAEERGVTPEPSRPVAPSASGTTTDSPGGQRAERPSFSVQA